MFASKKAPPKPCPGCEARAAEIERLTAQNDRLLNQVLILSGRPDAAVETAVTFDELEEAKANEAPDPQKEAYGALADIAERRRIPVSDFADA